MLYSGLLLSLVFFLLSSSYLGVIKMSKTYIQTEKIKTKDPRTSGTAGFPSGEV